MKNHITSDIRILTKSLKLPSPMDLINTRLSIWNFIICIQYLNIWIDEECSSTHENSGNMELLALWAFFKQAYIDTTDSWMEYLALWIWFTSTMAVYRPAVSIDVSPRISSSPVPATWCLFPINNSFSMWTK